MSNDDDTDPHGIRLAQSQRLTREQLLTMVSDELAAIEFDLDVLTQGFGLLMKEHNLEKQWRELQRNMSARRRTIGDSEPPPDTER
jgi:hypothetical protein